MVMMKVVTVMMTMMVMMNVYMHLMRLVLSGLKVGRTSCGDDESGDNGDDNDGEDECLHALDETGVE